MAIGLSRVNMDTRNYVLGNRRQVVIDFTLDNSYPTGGYSLPVSQLGVDLAPDYVVAHSSDGHTYGYDYAAQKLKVFSGGVEVTAATNLSAVQGRVVAQGKGHPTL